VSAEDLDAARLVARFQAGESEAFGQLYQLYFDRVYSYMRIVVKDPTDAEDLTQQAFLRVLRALPRFERSGGPFRGWLFVVVRNVAISELRKRGTVEPVDPRELERRTGPAPFDDSISQALGWITDRDLLVFIERLPLAQRQVIVLRYMLDLSHDQIAAILGRTPSDVRMLLSRAQRFLRERLAAIGRTPSTGRRAPMIRRRGHAYLLRRRRFSLAR
jgi:RNA polymerase sigma-70 factor (ECF subfamily)